MPKISIIPSLIGSIISGALSLTGMSVKGTIFQAHSSQDSVTFLLTEAQNGNYFSFHYELSLFHLGTTMIDFHSSSILPSWNLWHTLTQCKMQRSWHRRWQFWGKAEVCPDLIFKNIYWKCWNSQCGRLEILMVHALFLHILIKPSPQSQVKLKGQQRTAQTFTQVEEEWKVCSKSKEEKEWRGKFLH